jgi:molecular chaperone GrpE
LELDASEEGKAVSGKNKKATEESLQAEEVENSRVETDQEGWEVELEQAREEAEDLKDKLMRLAAEFENTRKRLQREKETALKYAEENILKELLPGIDNLERAMEQGRETGSVDSLLEGIVMTRDGLLETLKKFGVEPVASVGETFDPNVHEALVMEPSDEVEANVILREFLKGYHYKERLLRAAKVVVSSGPPKEDS